MLVSFFRRGSAPVLLCGGLLSAALFSTGLYLAGALCILVVCGLSGALHRRGTHRLEQLSAGQCASSSSRIPVHSAQPTDAKLTGIAHRPALEARLQQLAAEPASTRGQAPQQPTALLLLTVDAYDLLHEQAGAVAADVAMLTLSSALGRALPRQADLLARYNRSTFAVLLCATDLPGSLRVAARLRWAITRLGIANPHTPGGLLTISIGIAVHHDLFTAGAPGLLTAAEQTLLAATQAGHDALEYQVSGQNGILDLGHGADLNRSQKRSQNLSQTFEGFTHSPDPALDRGSSRAPRPSPIPGGAPEHGLPSVRAWTVERSVVLHSSHGHPVA